MTTFDDNYAVVENYGIKVLFGITQKQHFGIKLDYINNSYNNNIPNKEYIGVGIALEQVLFNFFNMGIETVGYVR